MTPALLTYPARPINGGHLKYALPKVGDWTWEPKYNGWRALVHVPTRTMWNRQGQLLSITNEFDAALEMLCSTLDAEAFRWVDCEALERRHNSGRGTLIALDVVPEPALADAPYTERRRWLPPSVLPILGLSESPSENAIYQSARIDAGLAAECWQSLPSYNARFGCDFYEGLVAKRNDSAYPVQVHSPEQTTSAWMKHRFIK